MSRLTINLVLVAVTTAIVATLVHADLFQQQANIFIGDEEDCLAASSIINSCADAMPTWDSASLEERAQCLCCDGSRWDPDFLDEPIESCYDYLTDELPASTEAIDIYSGLQDVCSFIGSVPCMATATGTNTATSTLTEGDTGTTACASAVSIMEDCQSEIPDFRDASDEEIAACICYDGLEWTPEKFDGYVSSCLTWAETANPTYYSVNTPLLGLCSVLGPVLTETPTTGLTDASNPTPDGGSGGDTGIGVLTPPGSTRTLIAAETATHNGAEDCTPQVGTRGSVCAFVAWILGLYIFV